jgi:translation initiation factor IF-2
MKKEKPTAKKRVHELAKELSLNSKELIKTIKKLGIPVTNHMSALEPLDVERVHQHFTPSEEKKVVEERVRPSVIRRRVKRIVPKPEEEKPPAEEPLAEVEPLAAEPTAEGEAPPKPKPAKGKVSKKPAAKVKTPAEPVREEAPEEPTPTPLVEPEEEKLPAETISVKEEPAEKLPSEPIAEPTPEKKKAPAKKKKAKPKEEPALIIKKAEPPPPAPEPAPSTTKETTRPKKKHVLISKGEPATEKVIRKKGRKETRVVVHTPKTYRKRGRKVIHEERAESASAKKPEITVPKAIKRKIKISELITVGELSKKMGVKASSVIKKLWELGLRATINQAIDVETAQLISEEFGYEVEKVSIEAEEILAREQDDEAALVSRPPVITVMGHVDHGKTKLLDAIRETNVTDQEAGGITQHIGAYHVSLDQGDIVFIDTPGHVAFTAMRARGSQITDVVVLVVAANDGVQAQTVEAINHARDAKVPIIVAVNKIDLPEADTETVKRALTEHGLVPEEWGGDTIFIEISAKQKTNIDKLLEMILLQAEILELKSNPGKPGRGVTIESRLDKGQGPVATVLIQEGTLRVGDPFVTGQTFGKVRAMLDDKGKKIKEAGPSRPVEVVGFSEIPQAGDSFIGVSEERKARLLVEHRQQKGRQQDLAGTGKVTLENLYDKIKKEGVKEIKLVVKADVHGSSEALCEALEGLSAEAIKVDLIHSSVGAINESDVMLAAASNAIIIGFNVAPDHKAQTLAHTEHVDARTYNVIYDVVDDIKKAMEGLLEPIQKEKILGRAEVLEVFEISKTGTIAGSKVVEGKITRGALARLLRGDEVIHESKISSLKRFKDDVKEALTGYECGIGLEDYKDLESKDVIEAYMYEEIAQKLE